MTTNFRIAAAQSNLAGYMYGMTRRDLLAASALGLLAGMPRPARAAAPQGQLTWAVHVSLAPTWFDPADTQAMITPFMVLYALHDAMVKPMPGNVQAPCLAESWRMSEDGIDLGLHDPRRRQIPQRRAGDRRGRQVLVRALSRRQPGSLIKERSPRSRFPMRGTSGSS